MNGKDPYDGNIFCRTICDKWTEVERFKFAIYLGTSKLEPKSVPFTCALEWSLSFYLFTPQSLLVIKD